MTEQEPEHQPRRKLQWYHVTEREVALALLGFAIGAAFMVLVWVLAG
jgi:hypothetical protein